MSGRPLTVAVFTPTARGGHARYSHELLSALQRLAGADLQLSLVTSEDLEPEFRSGGYGVHAVLPPLARRDAFRTTLGWAASRLLHYRERDAALLRWVKQHGPIDIVHYQEPPLLPPVHFRAMKRTGARLAATVHNVVPHRYRIPLLRPATDALAHAGWRSCDALFVHSAGLRDRLASLLGPGSPPILVSPHGSWSVAAVVEAGVQQRLQARTLLLFGVQRRNKGAEVALDALAQLPGFRLVIAGAFSEPGLLDEVRARVASGSLPVEIVDRYLTEEEVAACYGEATLAVLPYTDFQAESGVLHLAVSHRVPLVVSDVGALGESVRRHGVGRVFAPRDVDGFVRAVREAVEPAAYEAARRACEEVARAGFEETARATLEGYRSLMRGPPR